MRPADVDVPAAADQSAQIMSNADSNLRAGSFAPDSPAAWSQLWLALALATFGSVGMWSVVVALPAVQADFEVTRGGASLPFALAMLGFGVGGVAMGRITDRVGVGTAIVCGIASLSLGYVLAGLSGSLMQYALCHVLVGFGASATFGPLMAEVSHWFSGRRALAIGIASSGNYLAGALWPPLIERGIAWQGWRLTHISVGLICLVGMGVLFAILRKRQVARAGGGSAAHIAPRVDLRMNVNTLTALLGIAGIACCVAMAMPQVHIVALCADRGFGAARGAEMLALMLGCGIVARIATGFLADRIGGLAVLLIGSIGQGLALSFYLLADGLTSLYVVSALFGVMQGGIVPAYAIIVRETMPLNEVATRTGIVIFATVVGMAFGGWISGVIFDYTGSYGVAFIHGIGWNVLNGLIACFLLLRARPAQPVLKAA